MGACRLLLLGPPLVARDDRAAPIKLRKAVALAAYLAVERRAFSREYLATLLWPDLGQQSGLANLRRMLTHLRETLSDPCIKTDGTLVQIDTAVLDVDVQEFQSLLNRNPGDVVIGHLEAAAALYRGSFLEGFSLGNCQEFDEWQDGVRRRIEGQFDELLESLCRGHLRTGQIKAALPFALRWLELDHVNEAAHRMLMEIHARAGRGDLVRSQFESCTRTLAREGLEPEKDTLDLYQAITGHKPGATSALPAGHPEDPAPEVRDSPQSPPTGLTRPPRTEDGSARRRLKRRIVIVAAGVLILGVLTDLYVFRRFILGSDPSVASVEPFISGNELTHVQIGFRNHGIGLPQVRYAVVFSSDRTVVAPRDYMVYADEIGMRRNGELAVDVDRWKDIQKYVDTHGVRIPTGNYSVAVIIDPEERIWEASRLNNRLASSTQFFYPGTAAEEAFAVQIKYSDGGTLDPTNPLKLFVGDGAFSLQREAYWAQFVVAGEGTYFLPVADVPDRDTNGSGYVLAVIHDVGNDLKRPTEPGPGDVPAILGEAGKLSYGMFDVTRGMRIHPGGSYAIEFSPPAPPKADAYEVDDYREIGTAIDYAALPVRQHHTFHDEGTGDTDQDWFRITLRARDTRTVETYSAGGVWECDTAIDISDTQHYIRTGNDKSEYDMYSKLTYTNDTGVDHLYFIEVKPNPKYATGINRFADYIVEFRR
jgi:DNA-binding SARP family transcriptional activator